MFFLLRMAFWLGVVCVLLPSSGSRAPEAQINPKEAVTFASAAVSDMRGFCQRQPDACTVGGKVASALGYKAEAGARTLYQFIASQVGDITASISARRTAATTPASARKTVKVAPVATQDRGTLTAADRELPLRVRVRVPLPPRRAPRGASPSA